MIINKLKPACVNRPARQPSQPGRQPGKSAFDWDVYKNRKTALQYLRRYKRGVDIIIESEDGNSHELVHSQVLSAFGQKLNDFVSENGKYVDSYGDLWRGKIKLIRLPRLTKYTLNILVDCAYTGYIRTDLASGGIWDVLDVADTYQIVEVIRACCTFLVKNLDPTNCVHFYHIGIKYRHPLQRSAWHKIRANFKHILAQNLRQSPLYSMLPQSTHQMAISHSTSTSGPSDRAKSASGSVYLDCDSSEVQSNQEESIARRSCLALKTNDLATIKLEHFEPLLSHDKLNVDNEESVWHAIRMWCHFDFAERASKITQLLQCMRFPRFRTGTEFSAHQIWRDPLIMQNRQAQQQLAILDRNHRDFLTGSGFLIVRDGFSLPCSVNPRQLRPRVPHSVLLAIGGWQQGQPTTLIESYDANCNLWFECQRRTLMPLAYHGIEYINGLLYICGGTDGSEILNELFTFDPIRGDCSQKVSMRESRCYVSTSHLNGFLYAMGGHNGSQRMKSVERFDVANESWSHVQEMSVARSDASACVFNGKIYIAGGLNEQVIESSVEFYNHLDNSWTFIASMITPRTSFSLLLYKNTLLAIGGNNGTERLNSVEQYDFNTKQWSAHSNMRHKRSTFSAALMDQSKLIVVGGYNGQTPFSQVETFDEHQNTWVALQKIRYDRSGLKVVVVSDLPNAAEYTYLGNNMNGSSREF